VNSVDWFCANWPDIRFLPYSKTYSASSLPRASKPFSGFPFAWGARFIVRTFWLTRNQACGKPYRGFKSHPFRHNSNDLHGGKPSRKLESIGIGHRKITQKFDSVSEWKRKCSTHEFSPRTYRQSTAPRKFSAIILRKKR